MIEKLLSKLRKFELDVYRNLPDFISDCVPFTGAPQKHPFLDDKVILIADPFSPQTFYYEFGTSDIVGIEELPHLVTLGGESVMMIRIWVKNGSIATRSVPFVVENLSRLKGYPATLF